MIHVSLGHGGLEVWALQETQEKLIDQLGEGTDEKVSSGSASPIHLAPIHSVLIQQSRTSADPLPSPQISSETQIPVFPQHHT